MIDLSVQERLLILGMQEIPRFGNLTTMRIVTDLMALVSFTEKELTEWEIQFVEADGKASVKWNPSVSKSAPFDITPGMIRVLTSSMEKAENLPMTIVPLYDRLRATGDESKKSVEQEKK